MTDDACLHPWNYSVPPFRMFGNLYFVGNRRVSSHLIDTGDGLILIDTTFPQTAYLLLESVRRLGFDPDDIVYILHTHAHYDHIGGTRALVGLTGAKTCLGKDDVELLEKKPELTWAPEYGLVFHEAFAVDGVLEDGERISLGSTTVECLHTPGHTAGCYSFFFNVDFRGDEFIAGVYGGIGLATLKKEYLHRYGLAPERRKQFMQSLVRLKEKPVDVFLGAHPEHNQTFAKSKITADRDNPHLNPYVDSEAWRRFLEKREKGAVEFFRIE